MRVDVEVRPAAAGDVDPHAVPRAEEVGDRTKLDADQTAFAGLEELRRVEPVTEPGALNAL